MKSLLRPVLLVGALSLSVILTACAHEDADMLGSILDGAAEEMKRK